MPRNFFRRIEVVFPIRDPGLRRHLTAELLAMLLQDNEQARVLHANGGYRPVARGPGEPAFSAQNYFMAAAAERTRALA